MEKDLNIFDFNTTSQMEPVHQATVKNPGHFSSLAVKLLANVRNYKRQ